jgi:hypothetical protein
LRPPLAPLLVAASAAVLSGCVTPGVTAAVRRDPARLQKILDSPNHGGEDLGNLLGNSIAFDCADCAKALLRAGLKPDAGRLSAAALADREEIARLLAGAGADASAAISIIHAQTSRWGAGIPPKQAESAIALLKKLEREREASSDAPAPATPPPAAVAREGRARAAPSFNEEKRPDDYALIVGVGDGPRAESDAKAAAEFAKALGVPASHVVSLTGAQATLARLTGNLEGWLPDNVEKDSTVYFYFAGRGAADPKDGRVYLVPSDGDPRYVAQTSYALKRLYEKLGELKAKRVIAMLDAGFSGGADAGFNSVDGKIALLAAAEAGQSPAADASGQGLFTRRLLEGLDGAARDSSGRVTLKSLADYVKSKVAEDARLSGRVQVPVFESGGTATDDAVLRAN